MMTDLRAALHGLGQCQLYAAVSIGSLALAIGEYGDFQDLPKFAHCRMCDLQIGWAGADSGLKSQRAQALDFSMPREAAF